MNSQTQHQQHDHYASRRKYKFFRELPIGGSHEIPNEAEANYLSLKVLCSKHGKKHGKSFGITKQSGKIVITRKHDPQKTAAAA
jgi:hypothetical protein